MSYLQLNNINQAALIVTWGELKLLRKLTGEGKVDKASQSLILMEVALS